MFISPNINGCDQAELLPSRSKERDPAVLQGHSLPLTDLSSASNEISRSVTQTIFGLGIKDVKIASQYLFRFFCLFIQFVKIRVS